MYHWMRHYEICRFKQIIQNNKIFDAFNDCKLILKSNIVKKNWEIQILFDYCLFLGGYIRCNERNIPDNISLSQ